MVECTWNNICPKLLEKTMIFHTIQNM